MSDNKFDEFIPASELENREVTCFNDNGVRYITGGERTEEYLYMENMPEHLENKC